MTVDCKVKVGAQQGPDFVEETITVRTGDVFVITGPNGVGKSALLDEMSTWFGSDVEKFPGHRVISFQSDDIDHLGGQSVDAFSAMIRQNPQNANRYRNPWSEHHLKSVVKRVTNAQLQAASNLIAAMETGLSLQTAKKNNPQILDQLNAIFEAARLPVRMVIQGGSIKAQRGSSSYTIDRLSDGERAALLIAGAVLIQPANSFVIIDEPEKHLNPSISGPFIAAVIRSRADLGYLFSTHDLPLIEWMSPTTIIHIRDSKVQAQDGQTEQRTYDLNFINRSADINDDLKYAVLGTRRAVLLIEGTPTSYDLALYSACYGGWNIVPRGGWESVSSDVRSLNNSSSLHWVSAAGIVDGDGRTSAECNDLNAERIFPLSVPTVENIFCDRTVLKLMADASFDLYGGLSVQDRLDEAEQRARSIIQTDMDQIIARRLVWHANRAISALKISVKDVTNGVEDIPGIDLRVTKVKLRKDLTKAAKGKDVLSALKRIPIKNTGIPSAIVQKIGYGNFDEYRQSVLHQIDRGGEFAEKLLVRLRAILPKIS